MTIDTNEIQKWNILINRKIAKDFEPLKKSQWFVSIMDDNKKTIIPSYCCSSISFNLKDKKIIKLKCLGDILSPHIDCNLLNKNLKMVLNFLDNKLNVLKTEKYDVKCIKQKFDLDYRSSDFIMYIFKFEII